MKPISIIKGVDVILASHVTDYQLANHSPSNTKNTKA